MEITAIIEEILQNPVKEAIKENNEDFVKSVLKNVKATLVLAGNEQEANNIAIKECIYDIQSSYIKVFKLFKDSDFYEAWCLLERIEISIKWLLRHYKFTEDSYMILFIKKYVSMLQQLFPYKLFGSSEYVKKEIRCSICDEIITLKNRCPHRKGELYMGEMCLHKVTLADFIGMALVDVPFNRYSVAGVTGKKDDPYSYPEIKFLISIIDHPFNKWHFEKYYVHEPHEKYKQGRNTLCPCGSQKKYKHCCLMNNGVKILHTQFYIEEPTINSVNMPATQKKRIE